MRKWYVPLTMVGLGGLGLLFVSERGQQAVRWLLESFEEVPGQMAAFNEGVEHELARIESALDEISSELAQ
ncbi:MAG TPA: hypothetical protein VL382_01640 [Terriglobales bacterium]|nr:hypothetical protein [Terriglobales bacterium]